jgi:hypothetical protein
VVFNGILVHFHTNFKKLAQNRLELSPTVFKPNSRDPNEPTKIEVKNPTKRTRKIVRGIIHLLARLKYEVGRSLEL